MPFAIYVHWRRRVRIQYPFRRNLAKPYDANLPQSQIQRTWSGLTVGDRGCDPNYKPTKTWAQIAANPALPPNAVAYAKEKIAIAASKHMKSWAQISRENPTMQSADEQASFNLQRENPAVTLCQLRRRYPLVQFYWPKSRVDLEAIQERGWTLEVGRRTSWILLHFAGNVAIISCAFWLLLGLNKKAYLTSAAASFCIAVAASIFCHWRATRGASKIMSESASSLAGLLCIVPTFALFVAAFYGGITYFILTLMSVPPIYSQLLAVMAGLVGIAQTVRSHKAKIGDHLVCLFAQTRSCGEVRSAGASSESIALQLVASHFSTDKSSLYLRRSRPCGAGIGL